MNRHHNYFVYILASRIGGTLYVGVTSDVAWRVSLHRDGIGSGFTARHGIKRLVYCEHHSDIRAAIAREKRIKKWPRQWKVNLIECGNPDWLDLYPSLAGSLQSQRCHPPACPGDPVNTDDPNLRTTVAPLLPTGWPGRAGP